MEAWVGQAKTAPELLAPAEKAPHEPAGNLSISGPAALVSTEHFKRRANQRWQGWDAKFVEAPEHVLKCTTRMPWRKSLAWQLGNLDWRGGYFFALFAGCRCA